MDKNARIYVAGHNGLVGKALIRVLQAQDAQNLITRTHQELDLKKQQAVEAFFAEEQPEYVLCAAAKVGGILANTRYPAEFIRDNLQIQTNVLEAAKEHGVKKLLFMGSSCIYPKICPQPIKEEYLLTGSLEATNEWYAIAKIAGIKLCQAYRKQYGFNAVSIMPTNIYGPGDTFDPEKSHVIPGIIGKIDQAYEEGRKEVVLWGTGAVRREFLFVEDLAEACLIVMDKYEGSEPLNIGFGRDISIRELAEKIANCIGYAGEIRFDPSKPDGTPQKLLEIKKIEALGWKAKVGLEEGIRRTYQWYKEHVKKRENPEV